MMVLAEGLRNIAAYVQPPHYVQPPRKDVGPC